MSEEKPLPPNRVSPSADLSVVSNKVEGAGIVASRTMGSLHIGPLPSPETLEKYGKISPELLNTIVASFTTQAAHRQSIENWLFKGGTIRSILGVVFAFIMAMTAIIGGVYIVLHGYPIDVTIFGRLWSRWNNQIISGWHQAVWERR